MDFNAACRSLAHADSEPATLRTACKVIESHVAPLQVRKQRGFPSQLLSGVVALVLCQGHAGVDLRLLAEEVLLLALRRHGRVLGEKLVTEMIRYARAVAAPPGAFGDEIATATPAPPVPMRPHTRAAALGVLRVFGHQLRPAHARPPSSPPPLACAPHSPREAPFHAFTVHIGRHVVANTVVPLLVELSQEADRTVLHAAAQAVPRTRAS